MNQVAQDTQPTQLTQDVLRNVPTFSFYFSMVKGCKEIVCSPEKVLQP